LLWRAAFLHSGTRESIQPASEAAGHRICGRHPRESAAFAGVTKEAPPHAPSASPAPKAFAEAGITHNDVDHLMI
jgi:hypothetical protein